MYIWVCWVGRGTSVQSRKGVYVRGEGLLPEGCLARRRGTQGAQWSPHRCPQKIHCHSNTHSHTHTHKYTHNTHTQGLSAVAHECSIKPLIKSYRMHSHPHSITPASP